MEGLRLHEYDADQVLHWLSKSMDEYVIAKHESDQAEQHVKTMFARTYNTIRAAEKCSVEDAKMQVTASPEYIEAWKESLKLGMEKDQAFLKLEKARTAVDLWRSENANRRKV